MAEKLLNPFQFVVIALAGWIDQRQQNVIEYLREENRVLREQLGERRLRFTDDQRRRLAVRARGLGTQTSGSGGDAGHARYSTGLAPQAHRTEIRWQCEAETRSTPHQE